MLRTIYFTIFIGIALFLAQQLSHSSWTHPYIWYILTFFFGLSFLFHRLMENGMKDDRKKFVNFYLTTIVVRLIASIIFIGVCLYSGLTDSLLFTINFFVLYFLYMGFEIYGLYRNLRRN